MKDLCADLFAECSQLASLVEAMTPQQWVQKTPFYGWTTWDEIPQLCFFDETGMLAATDPEAFIADTAELLKQLGSGLEIDVIARARFSHLSGSKLVPYWRQRFERLILALSKMELKARLPGDGPMMGVRAFAPARMMESWAHGQDIYDFIGKQRTASDRIKNIAHLGASTFSWTFINRKLPVPEPAPYIELQAPSGKNWIWNDPPSEQTYLRARAEDFCLVVTQRRNVADTRLQYAGSAAAWLPIAQCYAGPPEGAPAPGIRAVRYWMV